MDTPWPYPQWIAHRGAGLHAPENTLAAFRAGTAAGWRAFECDVKLSADGVPFLLHDATLQRTTDGTGQAADRRWDELSRLDAGGWHSPLYAGEPPPTLAAIAHHVRRNGAALNIEIKPTPGTEENTGRVVAADAARLLEAHQPPPLLSSFRPEALMGARQGAPNLPRALLLDTLWPGWEDMARMLGVVAVVTNHRLMDAALCAQIHASGWRALCYTVNDPADVERLLALPVDGLISDEIERFASRARAVG